MINFFRKTRKKLADDNKFLKYSRYAIGEIALVMIGILLALQVNNWNETKKSKANIIKVLEDVQKELILNINEAHNIIIVCSNRDIIMYNINNRIYTIEDYKENMELTKTIQSEYYFTIIDNAFKKLMEEDDNNLEEFHLLINDLKNLYITQKQDIDLTNQDEKKFFYDFVNYLRDTKDWYSNWMLKDYSKNTDEIINYFLTDPSYFNFVADFYTIATFQKFQQSHLFRANAIESYMAIDEILAKEKKNHVKISPILINYNTTNFEHFIGCYKSKWGTAEIKLEEDKFLYTWNGDSGSSFTTNLYPASIDRFTIELAGQTYFYKLQYNEKREVVGKRSHNGTRQSDGDLLVKF